MPADSPLTTYIADLEWRVSKGLGSVHATTVVFPQQGAPYNVALIDVDEGFRMMSRVEDIAPLDVRIGMRVKFRVHQAEGEQRALADCGLKLKDVDGLFCATTQARTSAMSLCEYLRLPAAYTDSTIVGGSSFEVHVAHAQAALAAGLCSVAVITYGSTQRTVGRRAASPREYNPYETPFKPFLPATAYAMAANRHMHEFGTTREQLAEVAVAARQWALLNPAAWEKQPLSVADVLNARPISDPLTVRDCCLITDGGGAIVMVTADRARARGGKAAYVLGCGQSITHATISSMPDLTHTGAIQSGAQAYRMSGLQAAEVDVLALYDAFTINTILFLEDL